MNKNELEKMYKLEHTYWWHVGKLVILKQLLKNILDDYSDPIIVDCGCGTGAVTKFLGEFGTVHGFDLADVAVDCCVESGLSNIQKADIVSLPYKNNFADIIVSADILEHIGDDIEALKELHRVLMPGGELIITVPAYKFLWSEHDEALGHKRRYTRVELRHKLQIAGFNIEHESYSVMFLFPIIFLFRTWQAFFSRSTFPQTSYVILPKPLNNLGIKIIELEAYLMRFIRLPLGVTLNVVAKKVKNLK